MTITNLPRSQLCRASFHMAERTQLWLKNRIKPGFKKTPARVEKGLHGDKWDTIIGWGRMEARCRNNAVWKHWYDGRVKLQRNCCYAISNLGCSVLVFLIAAKKMWLWYFLKHWQVDWIFMGFSIGFKLLWELALANKSMPILNEQMWFWFLHYNSVR